MDENNESVDVSTLDTPPTPTSATISNWETPTPFKSADVVYGRPLSQKLVSYKYLGDTLTDILYRINRFQSYVLIHN